MTGRLFTSAIRRLSEGYLDVERLKIDLGNGNLLKRAGMGRKTYLALCRAARVDPWKPPPLPEPKRSLELRLKRRIAQHSREVKRLTALLEKARA